MKKEVFTNTIKNKFSMKIILFTIILFIGMIGHATTITVTNTNDSGVGSLRAASNVVIDGDIIRFDSNLISAGSAAIILTTGDIDFSGKSITIVGLYNNTDTLFISGNNSSRIFSFNGAAKVVLDSLVLINGNGNGAYNSGYGGAVYYENGGDTLHINNSVIRNNNSVNGYGGSVYSSSPSSYVSITNSIISGNTALHDGGGVYSDALSSSITITNSTISGNTASFGGGVYSSAMSSTVFITNSTISGNTANNSYGGGIYSSAQSSSIVTISNSTISGNTASGFAGGVYSNSFSSSSVINIVSSIVALNAGGNFINSQSPIIISGGYNIFSDAPSGAVSTDQTNITSTQLNLQPLAYNGGSTRTMLPGAGSVAINAGNPSDMSNAQNGPVCNTRDVGAAETGLSFSASTISACDSYTSPSGNYTWTQSGTYMDTIPNAAGCDSVITINLTINSIADQSVSIANTALCAGDSTTVTTASSETGVVYSLRDNANNTIVEGPVAGTGSGLSFNTGALSNSMTYNVYAEKQENALDFDGNNTYVDVNGINIAGSSFTIEAWAKRKTSGSYDYILGQGTPGNDNALHFGFRNNDKFTFAFWFDDANTTATYTDTLWHHWAATYDTTSNTQKIYRDGILVASHITNNHFLGSGTLRIGDTPWGGSAFNGSIDEVRVWNTVRTASEINATMNVELTGNESGLISYYNFNQGIAGGYNFSTTTLTDNTNNGNDGTLSGFILTGATSNWIEGAFSSCPKQMSQTVSVTVNHSSGATLFSDNFANNTAWNITSGDLIVSNNIASTEGNSSMTTAFANFSQPLGSGDVLQLTFNSNSVTNFATNGWAGVSLYTGGASGTEQIFIGSPGNHSNWGVDGAALGAVVSLARTSEIAQVNFSYNYDTGDWSLNVSGETVGGTIASGLAFDAIRIGADINNLADIAVSNLNVITNSGTDTQTACDSYTWIDGIAYTSSNNIAMYTLTNATGCDSVVTLNLTINNSTTGTDVVSACNSYTWIDGNTYTSSNNTATYILTNIAGCDSVVTLNLTINSVSDNTTSVSGVVITANNSNATYQWLDCDNGNTAIVGETGQLFTATANGNYAVELFENGCTDTSACVNITSVGIDENTFANNVSIYPNPTKGLFTVQLGDIKQQTTVIVYSIVGQKVVYKIPQTNIVTIDLSNHEDGIYFVKIQNGDIVIIKRVVKQ